LGGIFRGDEVEQALKVGERPSAYLDLRHAVRRGFLARRPETRAPR
jgi:hypothetical protein